MNAGTIRALLGLEWNYARHNALAVLRSPARLALWVPYAIALAYFGFARFAGVRHHAATPLDASTATGLAGTYLAIVGVAIALAALGRIQSFRCPAEAMLMSNAGMRPLAIAIWLQLRKIALGWTRSLGGLLYVLLITPSHATGFALVRSIVATVLAFAVVLSAELPAFLASRGRANAVVRIAGWSLVAIGAIYALAGFGGTRFHAPLIDATHVDPGAAVIAIATGNPIAIAVPFAIFAAFVAIVAARGDDTLPELYAAARYGSTLRARLARDGADRRAAKRRTPVIRPARVPSGALALVWKDWVAFRRSNGTTLFIVGAVAWAVFGGLAGFSTVRLHDRTLLGTFVVFEAVVVLFWAPSTAAAGLAGDLGKPLFWLSRTSLRLRLVAWTFARAWRGGFVVALGPLVASLIVGRSGIALATVPLAFVAYWSLQILGVGMYAAFPNPIDARGPLGIVRLIASFVYVLVPFAVAVGVVVVAHGPAPLAVAIFAAGLALEAWGVVELSAFRFASRGASLATIAQAT